MQHKLYTWHIHVTGIVQGVGFRPFVYQLAHELDITGWVKNEIDGVHIQISGTEKKLNKFYSQILSDPPNQATIISSSFIQVPLKTFSDFQIIDSGSSTITNIFLTPDFATCSYCRKEMTSSENKRFYYPFITCTECGPRYSIIKNLPFDRENTEMNTFTMCHECKSEYSNPSDRRFYSQTNSCNSCGVTLSLYSANLTALSVDNQEINSHIISAWDEGKIVAIKGIGGYLFTCDATNQEAVSTLRKRKRRPDKPLAVMFPGLNSLNLYNLSDSEKEALLSAAAPIVLVSKKDDYSLASGISDGHSRLGIMLPYAPIYHLLLHEYNSPIIATSGNISNSPIIYDDEKALQELTDIADLILTNNRKIVIPQDDSVVAYSSYFNQKIILRRSRGMAPSYYNKELEFSIKSTLAMGAHLKSTFATRQNENIYISQYLGDLDSYETELNYRHTLCHLKNLLHIEPEQILVDHHPEYRSTAIGKELADENNLPIIKVQHHISHFSALLGEHALMKSDDKILGVVWDGSGLGMDGNIWGGEFFAYENGQFSREAHLPYFPLYALDKMAKEPRLSALSLVHMSQGRTDHLESKFSRAEWNIYNKILEKGDHSLTSSMGRLFDGVASLLGLIDTQTYEGQAASLLQVKAEEHFSITGLAYRESYLDWDNETTFSLKSLILKIQKDLNNNVSPSEISAKFHLTLVDWIKHIAAKMGVKKVGFSGGVFQNTLLVDLVIHHLRTDYELLFHKDLSPNDENISFGQLIYAEIASYQADFQ